MDNGASSYRRFLAGDNNGLAEIVNYYKDGLILYLNSYINNIYIAEELTEDTFFKLISKKPTFKGKSSFKTWLYAIGRNVAFDYIRHNSKISNTSVDNIENYLNDEQNLEKSYIKEESKLIIYKALSKLTTDYKIVIWLAYYENLSNSEISSIIKKNPNQVKNLIYRAKQSLKSALEKEGFNYEEL